MDYSKQELEIIRNALYNELHKAEPIHGIMTIAECLAYQAKLRRLIERIEHDVVVAFRKEVCVETNES